MFIDRSVPRIAREYERFEFARGTKDRLIASVQECIEAGIFPASIPPMSVVRLLTTGVMGVSVMRLSDRLGPGDNADDIARDVLDVTIAGLQSGVAIRSYADVGRVPARHGRHAARTARTSSHNRSRS